MAVSSKSIFNVRPFVEHNFNKVDTLDDNFVSGIIFRFILNWMLSSQLLE